MPSTRVIAEDSIIYRAKDEGNIKEPVSNFSIDVIASVHVSSDAGGPGLLLHLKRHHDSVQK
jgi:hypothetical protein